MALQIKERWESGEGSIGKDGRDEYSAIVWGTAADNADDPYTVLLFAVQHFSFVSAQGHVLSDLARRRIAPFTWEFRAQYTSATFDRQTNDASYAYTTGGGTQHITHSVRTMGTFVPSGKTPINYKGTIGKDAEGVDIEVNQKNFRTTFYLPANVMTQAYNDLLESCTSKINSDQVTIIVDGISSTYQPGELLFRGTEGSKRRGFEDWELVLNWSAERNVTGITIGDITGISKRGWDYLWVTYVDQSQLTAGAMARIAKQVNVEQVYRDVPLTPVIRPTSFGQSNTQPWTTPTFVNGARTGG